LFSDVINTSSIEFSYPKFDAKRNELGNIGFGREMLLPEEGQDVTPRKHHLLRRPALRPLQLPHPRPGPRHSTKESADYTARVTGELTWLAGRQ